MWKILRRESNPEKQKLDHHAVQAKVNSLRRITTTEVTSEMLSWSSSQPNTSWCYDMEGHADRCVERYCELAGKEISALKRAETPCMDGFQCSPEDFLQHGRTGTNLCAGGIEMFVIHRNGRPDQLWTVSMLARSVAKWNTACGKFGTIDKSHRTNETLQTILFCWRRNSGLQTWIVSGCVFGWRCAKFQINFRRSVMGIWTTNMCSVFLDVQEASGRAKSEISSLDAGFRMALAYYTHFHILMLRRTSRAQAANVILSHLVGRFSFHASDHLPSNIPESSFPAGLCMFEDNEAVNRMILKGCGPNLRLVSRTHRVD